MAKKKPAVAKRPKKIAATKQMPAATGAKKPIASKSSSGQNGKAAEAQSASRPRLLPTGSELKSLYDRYTGGATFDDHDKAFYFALDVGGISRAKQLLAHVEEVLAELEEFH
jgi:hypothetical protein